MDALTLRFDDLEVERTYSAANFRAAYALHLSYTVSLLLMFAGAALDDTFRVASYTLGPGFIAVLFIRIGLHHEPDTYWAQSVGTWLMCAVDSMIWLASASVFRREEGRINASVIIYGLYCIAMVLYPIILMVRTFSHVQRAAMVCVAVGATTASPVWVVSLSQAEFISTNLSALLTGTLFAYFMEKLKRENELMHQAAIRSARETTVADSRLNHVLKNKIVVVDHRLDLARGEMRAHEPPSATRASASAVDDAGSSSQTAADSLLQEAQVSLRLCVDWIHRREIFMQLAHRLYRSSPQRVDVRDVLRPLVGPDVTLELEGHLARHSTLRFDTAASALAVEEAMSNARNLVANEAMGGGDGRGGAPPPKPPMCVLVDDDEMVQLVVTKQIERHGGFDTFALGATLDEQQWVEDVIMGVRDPTDVDVLLPAPHTPAAVAVIDLNLELSPPWPAAYLETRSDGTSVIPADGLDLAKRLRSRGFTGVIILHSAELLSSLQELGKDAAIDGVIEKGSAAHFKERFGDIIAMGGVGVA